MCVLFALFSCLVICCGVACCWPHVCVSLLFVSVCVLYVVVVVCIVMCLVCVVSCLLSFSFVCVGSLFRVVLFHICFWCV